MSAMIGPVEQRKVEHFAQILANVVAEATKAAFGTDVHFVVILHTDRDRKRDGAGFMTYVSSTSDRPGMVQLLREIAAKVESDPRKRPTAYVNEVPAVRFTMERLGDAQSDIKGVCILANGRDVGTLNLSDAEERALADRIHQEQP